MTRLNSEARYLLYGEPSAFSKDGVRQNEVLWGKFRLGSFVLFHLRSDPKIYVRCGEVTQVDHAARQFIVRFNIHRAPTPKGEWYNFERPLAEACFTAEYRNKRGESGWIPTKGEKDKGGFTRYTWPIEPAEAELIVSGFNMEPATTARARWRRPHQIPRRGPRKATATRPSRRARHGRPVPRVRAQHAARRWRRRGGEAAAAASPGGGVAKARRRRRRRRRHRAARGDRHAARAGCSSRPSRECEECASKRLSLVFATSLPLVLLTFRSFLQFRLLCLMAHPRQ